MTFNNGADTNYDTPEVPDSFFVRFIVQPLKKIQEFLSNLFTLSNAPISAIDSLDWELINQTRGRLARMRFRHKDNIAEESAVSDLAYHKNLQGTQLSFGTESNGPVRKTQRQAIMRWFAGGERSQRVEFERELETRFRDVDRQQIAYQKDSHELIAYKVPVANEPEIDSAYEPLRLPGVSYEISPSEPLLIEAHDVNEPINLDIGFDSFLPGTNNESDIDTVADIVSDTAFAGVPDIFFTDLTAGTKAPVIVSGPDSVTVSVPDVIADAVPASLSLTQIAR
jgi:hypothetical protein